MRRCVLRPLLVVTAVVAGSLPARAQPPSAVRLPNPVPYSVDEPLAEAYSPAKSAKYLDTISRFWMNDSCGSCHANYSYLLARPLLAESDDGTMAQTRRFLEDRVAKMQRHLIDPSQPIFFTSESVGLAFALAAHDRQTTGRLQPTTRQALDQMWALQRKSGLSEGTWSCGCGEFPLAELDRYFIATLAALATGLAPEGYVRSPQAQDGLTRLRRYLLRVRPPHLHHEAMLLWASVHVEGLLTSAERQATVQQLLKAQLADGGWSLPAMSGNGGWAVSDGYGTGLAVFVLRQAGVPASHPKLVRGVHWLQSNQRASGGWFAPTHVAGDRPEAGHGTRELGMLNTAAAFAVLALHACAEQDPQVHAFDSSPRPRGLALRGRLID
jgi:squalene-hopene/tetraprenyl-beta-curcumene cyclase